MWLEIINKEKNKPYFKSMVYFLKKEIQKGKIIFPEPQKIFLAFKLTPYKKVKVVILGQDPYSGDNQAHGLSFSVRNNQKTPPSLNNIFKELKNDLGIINNKNNLKSWALEGVLMLNSILTVERFKSFSHNNIGWQTFTENIFKFLRQRQKIVYILWGKFAQNYEKYIIKEKNYIIKSSHPSPLSSYRGFFNSKPFSKTNNFLFSQNIKIINWKT
ncbi:uracil-DNA glycosylase [Candidatus Phytoplasma pyri]|uniref:uracil-DNA glycosylase n=1 Tax=Candidatus Phytoplasma pyri TaxID=47566 RepID=UPI003982D94A